MIECKVDEPYVFNGEFELLNKGTPEYFVGGRICFPGVDKPDGTYRTKAGGVAHNAVTYAKTNRSFDEASKRLLNKRCPERPGVHEQLQADQKTWFVNNQALIGKLREKYSRFFTEYVNSEEECVEHHADPHDKRELRIQAYNELCEEGRITNENDLWVRSVLWKLKTKEYAKPGKKPRGICDLGVGASLRGAWITNILKTAQSEEGLEAEGGKFVFCKSPDPFELEKHFTNLINPEGRFYFVYFSDDSCLSIRGVDGVVRLYNLDISSCDASHGPALFDALIGLMPNSRTKRDMGILVKQCQLPIRIVSNANKNHVVFLKPKDPKLLSGSTITTAINNLANLAIAVEIVRSYQLAPDGVENPSMVAAAARVGYILTGCTPLKSPHHLQFLKHSPVQDRDGVWRPMLNLGVLLRASMTCEGDFPGRGPLKARVEAFQRGLLQGSYPYCRFEILDLMKQAVGEGDVMEVDLRHKVVRNDAYPTFWIDEGELVKRYGLDGLEYAGLLDFGRLKAYEEIHNEGVSKVLQLDYGLATTEGGGQEYIAYARGTQGDAWC